MKQNNPSISIIIPVLNEEKSIAYILTHLKNNSSKKNIEEIIIVDGGSIDQTISIATKKGATVISSPKGRAKQMNSGAKQAKGTILYFLHADTLPPLHFDKSILNAIQNNHKAGCFQMCFDSDSRFLKFFAWLTKINHTICRGGDQSLFITKKLFTKVKGFNEKYIIYEDNEFIKRLYKKTYFKILPEKVKTSARRYKEYGTIKLQYHFGVIHLKNIMGAGPEKLYDYYKRKIVI